MNDTIKPKLLSSPVQMLAFGFGSGLSPKAPGTVGTLAAIPLYLLLSGLSLELYSVVLLFSILAGIWICARASADLGVHDHPGIVWDEFVGMWITLWAVPAQWQWILAGFVIFRLLDIAKPWPISWLDRNVHGGLGIMIDDILAGITSCALLHGGALLLSTL